MLPLEVPIFSPESAALAIAQHARRLEINRDKSYPEGGLTPTVAELRTTLSLSAANDDSTGSGRTAAAIRVMIRPRGPPPPPLPESGGQRQPDFVYTEAEFAGMVAAIGEFKTSGLMSVERGDGFVFGCLRGRRGEGEEGLEVDVPRNSELVKAAQPFPTVFHRAFDDIIGSRGCTIPEALQGLKSCGFHGVLTSGGPGSAIANQDALKEIVALAPGLVREVIVGGGVRSTNAAELKALVTTVPEGLDVWFHSSCLMAGRGGDLLDGEEVAAIVKVLSS